MSFHTGGSPDGWHCAAHCVHSACVWGIFQISPWWSPACFCSLLCGHPGPRQIKICLMLAMKPQPGSLHGPADNPGSRSSDYYCFREEAKQLKAPAQGCPVRKQISATQPQPTDPRRCSLCVGFICSARMLFPTMSHMHCFPWKRYAELLILIFKHQAHPYPPQGFCISCFLTWDAPLLTPTAHPRLTLSAQMALSPEAFPAALA